MPVAPSMVGQGARGQRALQIYAGPTAVDAVEAPQLVLDDLDRLR